MVVDVRTIESTYWSPKLGTAGEIVENVEDINQCIEIILTTPAGSDPHRPDFANRLGDYIDRPITEVTPLLIKEVYASILKWETRVELNDVKVSPTSDLGKVEITVLWSIPNSIINEITRVTI